jgi:hypothetical protein
MSLYPRSRVNNIIDNPLLNKSGIPVTRDDFVDSSERILNASGSNLLYQDVDGRDRTQQPIYFMDTSNFYNENLTPDKRYDLGRFKIEYDHSIPTPSVSDNHLPYQIYKESLIKDPNSLDHEQTGTYINIPNQINNQNINDNQNININENIKYTSFYEGMTETLRRVFLNIYNNQVSKETFTKNNGLFYLGMFIIFIAIIVFILSQIN